MTRTVADLVDGAGRVDGEIAILVERIFLEEKANLVAAREKVVVARVALKRHG